MASAAFGRKIGPIATQHVFLIPGFFGFVNFGRLIYFGHVRDYLEDAFAREGLAVEIHRVRVGPTSSLRVRATQLLQFVHEAAPEGAPLHFIGHSTGGLDARLLVSPGLSLDAELDPEPIARRVRSIVTIASPHRGTPLADFFSSLMGQQVLRLISLGTITVLRHGRLPVGLLARAAAAVTGLALRRSSPPRALLDHLESELLGKLGEDRVHQFVADVHGDQTLMPQLTPASMDVFDAATGDRDAVSYACVTSAAKPPRFGGRFALGAHPWSQATYSLYGWLYRRVGEGDGIVPLASQRHGELLHHARGDHLDIIGHFHGPDHRPPHTDWLATGSGFDRAQFDALWTQVARFIAQRARASEQRT